MKKIKLSLYILCLITVSVLLFTGCDTDLTLGDTTEPQTEETDVLSEETDSETELSETGEPETDGEASYFSATQAASAGEAAETANGTAETADTKTETETETTVKEEPKTNSAGKKIRKSKNFFDNVVFIGDSVSLGLKNYVTSQRNKGVDCLGKAQFLVAGSMGFTNSLGAIGKQDTIHPKYNGKEVLVEDGVALTGASRAFIMLGLNEFAAYNIDTSMKNAKTFITRIIEKNPGIKIYIQSVTPVISSKEHGKFTNAAINSYNDALKHLCAENGWNYVDVASVMKNSDGCFKDEYCGDKDAQGVHMNYTGCKAWVEYLTGKYC